MPLCKNGAMVASAIVMRAVQTSLIMTISVSASAAVITCGSVNGRYQYCAADTGRGVQLKQQLSHAKCLQSQSWGYDRGGVWVTDGCAANFSVGSGGGESAGGRHSDAGAAIVGGLLGAMLGAAVAGGGSGHTTTHSYTSRTYSGPPQQEPGWVTEQKIHDSRMASIRAGMDPDTDVMAAQLRANQAAPSSTYDAVRRDQMQISNTIDEDRARIEAAATGTPDAAQSAGDQRAEFQANQDFQREVMQRRADENSQDNSDSAAAEETPQ